MNSKKISLIKITVSILATFFILFSFSQADDLEMLDMDLSSLMQIQITSAGRKAQDLVDVPAAVYVIDRDDIQNSSATCVPELLRMVPGLQVARISSSKWAIASRGFNGTFSNKLLVQIDGRSVYTSAYSGVYWDTLNLPLENIEQIEVIRGPGATLWGANAVNGVINIITKTAAETQGGKVTATMGNQERGSASFRYGKQLKNDLYGRFYASHHAQDSYTYLGDKSDADDDWQITTGGFRLDNNVGINDSWTFQGDIYHGENNQWVDTLWIPDLPYLIRAQDQVHTNGGNLLGRWEHGISEKQSWTLQVYYDFTTRDEIYLEQTNHIVDIDFQHRFQVKNCHDLVWGMGYRVVKDDFSNSYQVEFSPDSQTNNLVSAFLQDEIALLKDRVWLTIGSKFEHNEYSGFEVQPNLRLLWKPQEKHSLWASIARAVRTPSRAEDSGKVITYIIPPPFFTEVSVWGNSDFDSEELIAYEAGYRYIPSKNLSIDMTLYYNDYRDLQSYSEASPFSPVYFVNSMEGQTYGLEITTTWTPADWIDTEFSYTYIDLSMEDENNESFQSADITEGSSPQNQFYARANIKLRENLRLNLWGHYTDQLKASSISASSSNTVVDDYINFNANIKWSPKENLEITLAGENLFDNRHLEFIQEAFTSPIEVERSIYLKITWAL
ncbi:putative TonB dependent receptor (outer membrane receptor family protein) [Desulforapulum autotrophicum HRM2]|uniref:TonB dependent receptor (Outer membrane receptor family protein) n=1 Tax=Desulforapulum autotrophicum (strain ATCC 43914 / DSM 3382 / VKM B-1955 / HRM2) TaxID=177437 RepID=C0QF74_DESAH|nr:TonB-dependent receptor [Desulforapulum autotrophicum]ACN17575.1 putative TonB dependent receptor (outer membrane receptor family protein) [Desulforapulum autotrophicum HRM2]